jgi:hypothetical protein
MEQDESDVFGYCLLYELDRKSKEVFQLEYVILDKNLNKLTSISLTQAVVKSFWAQIDAELTFVKKTGNQLTIGVNDHVANATESDLIRAFNYRFINLDLDNFTFSKEYKCQGFAKIEHEYKAGDKLEMDDFWDLQKLIKTKGDYFLAFASPEYNPKSAMISNFMTFNYKRKLSIKRFAVLDKDLNTVWSKDINTDKETSCEYEYLDSDSEVLLLKKETLLKKSYLALKSIEAYDIKTGKLLGEMKIEDKDHDNEFFKVTITKDKIHVFTDSFNKKSKREGYGHLIFDKYSVAETGRQYILWKDLRQTIPGVNELGKLGKEDFLMVQDFVFTPKGNLLMIAEDYNTRSGYNPLNSTQKMYAQLKDMYLVEFNPDISVAFSKKLEKKNSVEIPPGASGIELRTYGYFDYIFCQKIDKAGDFVLYYTINDQEGSNHKMTKKPLWTLGIASNVDAQYGFETLPLYGDDLKIYPGLAKNGYLRLLEVNQKTGQAEMRLEKINY